MCFCGRASWVASVSFLFFVFLPTKQIIIIAAGFWFHQYDGAWVYTCGVHGCVIRDFGCVNVLHVAFALVILSLVAVREFLFPGKVCWISVRDRRL